MPTLNIEGRKVTVDDSFLQLSPEDQQATVEEIASQLGITSTPQQDAPVSGFIDQFRAGLESNTELPGQTLEEFGKTVGSDTLAGAGSYLRNLTEQPENFVSASDRFINPQQGDSYVDPLFGFGWGNLPKAAAEVTGQMTGDLAARSAGAGAGGVVAGPGGAVVGGLTAPALLEFMRTAGPIVKQRMQNDGRTEATWEDWTVAASAAGLSGILNTIGIKNVGVLNKSLGEVGKKTATEVVKDAGKETLKKAGKEGLTETGQSVVTQYGETAGTEKGATINLRQALGEGVLGFGAAGAIDATRNVRPAVRNVLDIRSVDNSAANDPFARDKAEITSYVNDLASRPQQQDKELQSREINSYVNDLKRQALEIIKKQGLSAEDRKAVSDGIKDPLGLSDERLNQIAGRSDSPDEVKALANRIQLIRSLTVQQQAAKGVRGLLASSLRPIGAVAGAAVGSAMGTGPAEGTAIGYGIGGWLGRKVQTSQSQGARIDALVGAKQARRAELLLERYGPSEATKAMNTLTERAALVKAKADEEASILAQNAQQMQEFRAYQKQRAEMQKAVEQAKTREEKAKKQAEKDKFDLAHRELRLQKMALDKAMKQARLVAIAEKLDQQKSLNALTVEMTQVKADLAKKQADAKVQSMDRNAKFEVDNLRGRLEKLSLEIAKRQEALKKAQIATRNAEKAASRTPKEKAKNLNTAKKAAAESFKSMPVEQIADAKLDQYGNPISESTHYKEQKARIQNLENEGLREAQNFPDKATGNLFIAAIRKFQSYKGRTNQAKRMDVLDEVQAKVDPNDVEAQRFINTYILPLALAFDAQTNQSDQYRGREDFGSIDANDPETEIPF